MSASVEIKKKRKITVLCIVLKVFSSQMNQSASRHSAKENVHDEKASLLYFELVRESYNSSRLVSIFTNAM